MATDGTKESTCTTSDEFALGLGHKFVLSFCILLVSSICLTIALFIRIEMKFQQIDSALLNERNSPDCAKNDNSKHGRLTHNNTIIPEK